MPSEPSLSLKRFVSAHPFSSLPPRLGTHTDGHTWASFFRYLRPSRDQHRPSKSVKPPSSGPRVKPRLRSPSPRHWTRPARLSSLSDGSRLARISVSSWPFFSSLRNEQSSDSSSCAWTTHSHLVVWQQERDLLAGYQLRAVDAGTHVGSKPIMQRCVKRLRLYDRSKRR